MEHEIHASRAICCVPQSPADKVQNDDAQGQADTDQLGGSLPFVASVYEVLGSYNCTPTLNEGTTVRSYIIIAQNITNMYIDVP